jgi:hypothetical protein
VVVVFVVVVVVFVVGVACVAALSSALSYSHLTVTRSPSPVVPFRPLSLSCRVCGIKLVSLNRMYETAAYYIATGSLIGKTNLRGRMNEVVFAWGASREIYRIMCMSVAFVCTI